MWQTARKRRKRVKDSLLGSDSLLRILSNLSSSKLTLLSYVVLAFLPVPYETDPAENFLNSMILQVKVPVLSENT